MVHCRAFWRAVESVHSVVYFAAGADERYGAIGLDNYWMGYVASRSAAVGRPSGPVVAALFHGFAPAIVGRVLPAAWRLAAHDDILSTRLDLARQALTPAVAEADTRTLARDLAGVVAGLDLAGRPLAAAHAGLTPPPDDIGRLWHAATVLREYRGDCHVAVLVAAGIGGAEANALAVAVGLARAEQRLFRGWTKVQWAEAVGDLVDRGWADAAGMATAAGRVARAEIEDATDRACASGLDRQATERVVAVEDAVAAVARTIHDLGAIGPPRPGSVPQP